MTSRNPAPGATIPSNASANIYQNYDLNRANLSSMNGIALLTEKNLKVQHN